MHTVSQAKPDSRPAATSLAKCTRKNARLLPTVSTSAIPAAIAHACQRGCSSFKARYTNIP